MLVFRDGAQAVNGPRLLAEFTASLRQLSSISTLTHSPIMDALLRASELECALAETQNPAAGVMAETADALAALLSEVAGRTSMNSQAGSGDDTSARLRVSYSRTPCFASDIARWLAKACTARMRRCASGARRLYIAR